MGESQEYIDSDVLVIGGGLAGCRAALRARDFCERVVLVDKAVPGRSGASVWGHEILAPVPEGKFTPWMRELVEFTEFMCDQECVEILFREAPQRLREMEEWGVVLERDREGRPVKEPVRGMMDHCRAFFFVGRFWMDKVRGRVLSQGIKVIQRAMITDLLTSDGEHPTQGRVTGAVGFDVITGDFLTFRARAVVLATGPMSYKFPPLRVENCTGDGPAMAFRAGGELTCLEFAPAVNYYHMKGDTFGETKGFNQLQNHGAFITNAQGERVMEKYLPGRMERGSGRGPLGQAFAKEIMEGRGPLYFDMRHWGDERMEMLKRVIPVTISRLANGGVDLQKQRVEFKLLAAGSYGSGDGGIKVGVDGETNLPGLFAAGASSKIRSQTEAFGSASLANCNVFGYRAGEKAGRYAREAGDGPVNVHQVEELRGIAFAPLCREAGMDPREAIWRINLKVLPWRYSIIKQEGRIKEALAEVERVEREDLPRLWARDIHYLVKANEARSYALMARLYHITSLERKESRCKHYREDHPYRDDMDWLAWLIVKRKGEGVVMEKEPIPIERYPIKLDKRERIPTPVQVSYQE